MLRRTRMQYVLQDVFRIELIAHAAADEIPKPRALAHDDVGQVVFFVSHVRALRQRLHTRERRSRLRNIVVSGRRLAVPV